MQKKTILQSLKQDLKILQKQYGINSLFLFRSMARGTHTQTTDIDIPVTFHQPLGFFKFMDLKDLSENLLKSPIDLVTQYALHPRLRDQILKESIHVI